jgi:murein DD-endopeptidase MepM/ murein hydrolase activator NlpD
MRRRHQHLTLLLIPHDREKVGEFHLSRLLIYVLSLGLFVYVGAVCFYGSGYYHKAYQSALTDRYRTENEDLKRQLAGIQSELDLSQMHLDKLSETDEMMRAWTNTPNPGDDIRRLGVGGGEDVEAEWNRTVSPATADLLAETNLSLGLLQRKAEFLEGSFTFFADELSKKERVRRHTPSIMPVPPGIKVWQSSNYGYRTDPFTGRREFHNGIDFAGRAGDDVIATADGVVAAVGKDKNLGYYISIDHGGTFRTVYGHLRGRPPLDRGQTVERGDKVGKIGSTGRSTGPHLHYSVFLKKQSQNPVNYVYKRDRY